MEIIQAQAQHLDLVRDLFREYQTWLDADCCFQGFEAELTNLPGSYAAPKGVIYLAFDGDQAVGCSAIKPRADKPTTDAELKRLYIKESYRGHGLGKDIFKASMLSAKQMGYEAVVLETLPEKMKAAQFLYKDYGFETISAYGESTDESIQYLRYMFKS